MTYFQTPFVSVIISTYNRPDLLALTLESYHRQHFNNFEIIIADDGSNNETSDLISQWQKKSHLSVKHVWQEHQGFRKAKILNSAVLRSQGNFLIFSDQDCLVLKDFIQGHVTMLKKHDVVFGSRRWVPRRVTLTLLRKSHFDADLVRKSAKMNLLEESLRFIFRRLGKCVGCNIAMRRNIFFGINGFNGNIEGYGSEDGEMGYRLIKAGTRYIYTHMNNPVYHLWHNRMNGNMPDFNKNSLLHIKNLILGRIKVKCTNSSEKLDDWNSVFHND